MFLSSSLLCPLGGILFTIMSASGHLLFISCIRESSCCTTSATGCPLARSFPAHCRTTTSGLKSPEKMAGTLSLNTGSSHPGYIKDVADTCCRDTLWAKPRTSEVPIIATDGLSGTWVEAEDGCLGWEAEDGCLGWEAEDGCLGWEAEDGCLGWEAEDGCLGRPRLRPGVDEGWSEDTTWSVCTGQREDAELTLVELTVGLVRRFLTLLKPVSFIPTAAKSELAAETTIFQVSEITGHICFITVTFRLHIRAVVGRRFVHSLKT